DADFQTAEIVARLNGFLAVALTHRHDHTDRLQAFPPVETWQRFRRGHVNIAAHFFASMTFLMSHMSTRLHVRKIILKLQVDVVDDRLVHGLLVALQSQDVIGLAVDDLLGNRFLRSHGVDGDNGAPNVHQAQQLGNRSDFIRFLGTRHLSQRQAKLASPHTDRMQSAQAFATIMTTPRRLAIDRQHRLVHAACGSRLGTQRLQPGREASLKRGRLQQRQHAPKNIFARNPVGQLQHPQQQFLFRRGPLGNGGRPAGTRQDGHQCDDDHAHERMLLIDARTWILQSVKIANDLVQTNRLSCCHDRPSVFEKLPHGEWYTRSFTRAQAYPDYPKCALALVDRPYHQWFGTSLSTLRNVAVLLRLLAELGIKLTHLEG